ncbi:MAG: hypothetical protein ABEL04_03425 [Salinibacter sp.]|uniref:hypothetical protein n=1 Tax=Salinibacter sp. TaxID=2065818 RepID=UPI0035D4C96F
MSRSYARRALAVGLGALLVILIVLPACSDDPILGPSDGSSDGNGSYSSINRLAPPSSAVDSSSTSSPAPPNRERVNPERF